ncbi:MAG TPA: radical SAM protein [Treponemataceae bacterium]|jgi:radical SAM protein with 4Fe4S-binding SPASM domain|nr:radical SAM protein [Treponemataceae bacterium]HPX46814.1 radical SAM protein [Treponemataceae bacterium]HQL32847.1 radical SAM protein [Treponemataceae bacterium]
MNGNFLRRFVNRSLRRGAYTLYTAIERREHKLLYLFFELTRRCNMSCRHCGSDCGAEPAMREMDTPTWMRIVSYVRENFSPLPFIVLTGGEPTIRPDLEQIAGCLHENGFRWGMVTNGFALTRAKLDALIERGLSSITLSLDGKRDAHNYLRNSAHAYDRAIAAADLIASSSAGGHSIAVRDAVTCVFGGLHGNLGDLDDIGETLVARGFTSWRLFRIFPKGRAATDETLRLSADELRYLLAWIADRRPFFLDRGLSVSFSCEGYLPFAVDRAVRSEPFFCRSGITIASILADGTISGCNNNSPDFYQGSVASADLRTVWDTGFQKLRNRQWLKTGECATCRQWKYCQGNSLHLRGSDEVPGFCFFRGVQ